MVTVYEVNLINHQACAKRHPILYRLRRFHGSIPFDAPYA